MMKVNTKIKLLSISIAFMAIFIVSTTAFCEINNKQLTKVCNKFRLITLDNDYSLYAISNPCVFFISIESGDEYLHFPEGFLSLKDNIYTGVKKVFICANKVTAFNTFLLNELVTDIPPPPLSV